MGVCEGGARLAMRAAPAHAASQQHTRGGDGKPPLLAPATAQPLCSPLQPWLHPSPGAAGGLKSIGPSCSWTNQGLVEPMPVRVITPGHFSV